MVGKREFVDYASLKAITLWQPWATLIALGLKQYETRSWATAYHGPIAIHASKRQVKDDELAVIAHHSVGHLEYKFLKEIDYPLGAIVCLCDLTGCLEIVKSGASLDLTNAIEISSVTNLERAVGLWEPYRFAWKLQEIKKLELPVPCRGYQKHGDFRCKCLVY